MNVSQEKLKENNIMSPIFVMIGFSLHLPVWIYGTTTYGITFDLHCGWTTHQSKLAAD